MLRAIFEQPRRKARGQLKKAFDLMQETVDHYKRSAPGEKGDRRLRLLTWTRSIAIAFDELEQSVFCSNIYAERIYHDRFQEMDEEERDDFRRQLYYYKNAFIRLFSVLDKLGSFMNEQFSLKTEHIKDRYSYYTVLRRMRETRQHTELQQRLDVIKEQYSDAMQDLRSMRNHEVHAMNIELIDDTGRIRRRPGGKEEQIETVRQNQELLRDGFSMVSESLVTVFEYIQKRR